MTRQSAAENAHSTLPGTLLGSASGQSGPEGDTEITISEMAELFSVTMRTLRFYESKSLLAPRRSGNRRYYNAACVERMKLVLKGKSMGFGLDSIQELVGVVESDKSDAERAQFVRKLCEAQRETLVERRSELDQQIQETDRVLAGLARV